MQVETDLDEQVKMFSLDKTADYFTTMPHKYYGLAQQQHN